eukprot:TRINITY_DN48_c0_g5_i1.p1 TRINITY_DN48_c0_g5~~TRINITY_DN48_c0_g5_i1.p1  ORF type:complete len:512 (+),score=114.68 TRINITY_DN48_c0_g5_i1:112-1536(+)
MLARLRRCELTRSSAVVDRLDSMEARRAGRAAQERAARAARYAWADTPEPDSTAEDAHCGAGDPCHGYDIGELTAAARKLSCGDVARVLRVSCGCTPQEIAAFAEEGVDGLRLLQLARRPAELVALLQKARCPRRRRERIQRELRMFPSLLWGMQRGAAPTSPRVPLTPSAPAAGSDCSDLRGSARLSAALARSQAYARRGLRDARSAASSAAQSEPSAATPEAARSEVHVVSGGLWMPAWRPNWYQKVEAALERRKNSDAGSSSGLSQATADDAKRRHLLRLQELREQREAERCALQRAAEARERELEEARRLQSERAARAERLRLEREQKVQVHRRYDREQRQAAARAELQRCKQDADTQAAIISTKRAIAAGQQHGRRVSVVNQSEADADEYVRRGSRTTADVNTCIVGPPKDGWTPLTEVSVAEKEAALRAQQQKQLLAASPRSPATTGSPRAASPTGVQLFVDDDFSSQ